jgi:hypothetical protein
MSRRTAPPRPPTGPPANVEEGEARVRAALIKLFDRNDGTGADWKLMLGSLFRAGFKIADDQLGDDVRRKLMMRVHEEAEVRITGGFADGSSAGEPGPAKTTSPQADLSGLKSPKPKGPR